MPEVSVIVPVYRSVDTIRRCLASLAAQTMDDIEIVLVDDHGGDGSIDEARDFASSYAGAKRFVFIATERNAGPGPARNAGIDAACGKYLAFVDSDDTVDPEFCETLWNAAESAESELACCDIEMGGRVRTNCDVSDKKRFLRHYVSYFMTFLYRKDFIDRWGIRFPSSFSAEDTCFLTCSVLASSGMAQVHKVLYRYISNEESVSHRRDCERARNRMTSIRAIVSFAKKQGLYGEYRRELNLIVLKKGCAMALKDIADCLPFRFRHSEQ